MICMGFYFTHYFFYGLVDHMATTSLDIYDEVLCLLGSQDYLLY